MACRRVNPITPSPTPTDPPQDTVDELLHCLRRARSDPRRRPHLAALPARRGGRLTTTDTCRLYLANRVPDEPDAVWVVEAWKDEDAHPASLQLNAVRSLIEQARPIIAAMPTAARCRRSGERAPPDALNVTRRPPIPLQRRSQPSTNWRTCHQHPPRPMRILRASRSAPAQCLQARALRATRSDAFADPCRMNLSCGEHISGMGPMPSRQFERRAPG